MSDRTIWIVRIFGIVVFLVMVYLLISLQSKLRRMQNEAPPPAAAETIPVP